jgi:hypothetical protein
MKGKQERRTFITQNVKKKGTKAGGAAAKPEEKVREPLAKGGVYSSWRDDPEPSLSPGTRLSLVRPRVHLRGHPRRHLPSPLLPHLCLAFLRPLFCYCLREEKQRTRMATLICEIGGRTYTGSRIRRSLLLSAIGPRQQ